MYIKMSETFIEIDSLQHLEISRQTYPSAWTGQKSTLQHSLFWRYAKFLQNNAHYTYIHD